MTRIWYWIQGDFRGIFWTQNSTLLYQPPLRFHCVEGCWDCTYDCCNFCMEFGNERILRNRVKIIVVNTRKLFGQGCAEFGTELNESGKTPFHRLLIREMKSAYLCMVKHAWNSAVITAWSEPNFQRLGTLILNIVFGRCVTRQHYSGCALTVYQFPFPCTPRTC